MTNQQGGKKTTLTTRGKKKISLNNSRAVPGLQDYGVYVRTYVLFGSSQSIFVWGSTCPTSWSAADGTRTIHPSFLPRRCGRCGVAAPHGRRRTGIFLFFTHVVDDTADHLKWRNHYPNMKRIFRHSDLGGPQLDWRRNLGERT